MKRGAFLVDLFLSLNRLIFRRNNGEGDTHDSELEPSEKWEVERERDSRIRSYDGEKKEWKCETKNSLGWRKNTRDAKE